MRDNRWPSIPRRTVPALLLCRDPSLFADTILYEQCWCSANPELTKNGPQLDPSECNTCTGTTAGNGCGGLFKMLVYEITSYQPCNHRGAHQPTGEGPIRRMSEDEQIIGLPWDYQEKFDTTKFAMATKDTPPPVQGDTLQGVCDV